ncbi:unnamed protein product [Sphagnum jensenii]|uniref:Uncharacterized protein n=1 Tax=Sphagnum jensenii TaxID=128206 RepID=A0ABP1A9T7_9BRYO
MGSTFADWIAAVRTENGRPNTLRIVGEVDHSVCRDFHALVPMNILLLMRYVLSDWMMKTMNGVNNRIPFQLMTPPAEAATSTTTSTTAEDVMAREKKSTPRLYWKSLEFIGPSLYKLELWKAPVCLFLRELTIRRVLDTRYPFSLPCDDTAVEKHELVIYLQSGFYKCVFVMRQDGSYLNSLTLTRL